MTEILSPFPIDLLIECQDAPGEVVIVFNRGATDQRCFRLTSDEAIDLATKLIAAAPQALSPMEMHKLRGTVPYMVLHGPWMDS